MIKMTDYTEEQFSHNGFSFPVYRKGQGAPVIILHELPGLTQETKDFADFIEGRGFQVFLPKFFGAGFAEKLCILREFNLLSQNKASPVSNAVRALSQKIHNENNDCKVGAIGMCLTGGMILTLMLDDWLAAPVIAQPALPFSLPFFPRCSMDVDESTLTAIKSGHCEMLALRFDNDWKSPQPRMQRLVKLFTGSTASGAPKFNLITIPGKGHSTLTYDYPKALGLGVDTRVAVVNFLKRNL